MINRQRATGMTNFEAAFEAVGTVLRRHREKLAAHQYEGVVVTFMTGKAGVLRV